MKKILRDNYALLSTVVIVILVVCNVIQFATLVNVGASCKATNDRIRIEYNTKERDN
jgi:hypothetical protein